MAEGKGREEEMENSFNNRVDQIFGALFQSSSGPGQGWSLSEEQVKKRQWRRDEVGGNREGNPCASSFDGLLGMGNGRAKKKPDWDDGRSDDDDDAGNSPDDDAMALDDEGRQMRSVVGLDSTLDQEDEEDEYDKVAVGREDAGERTYMREIMECGPKINSHNALPVSLNELKHTGRDPRANHLAARARLKEDDEDAAANSDSEMVDKFPLGKEEQGATPNAWEEHVGFMNEINGITAQRESGSPPLQEIKPGMELKSIMKGKRKQMESQQTLESEPSPLEDAIVGDRECNPIANSSTEKLKKRVRFEPGCKGDPAGQLEERDDVMKCMNSKKRSLVRGGGSSDSVQDVYSRVPDYVKYPSKYIHYTLDWSNEDDDKLNMQAFKDFSQLVKPSGIASAYHMGNSVELPKSVTFIPRKKTPGTEKGQESLHHTNNAQNMEEDSSSRSDQPANLPVGIAAGHAIENETHPLGNDLGDFEKSGIMNWNAKLQRSTRQYRSKAKAYEETGA